MATSWPAPVGHAHRFVHPHRQVPDDRVHDAQAAVDFLHELAGARDVLEHRDHLAGQVQVFRGSGVDVHRADEVAGQQRRQQRDRKRQQRAMDRAHQRTGGTEAIRALLQRLPEDAPPVLVCQHMPSQFTRAFAERLDRIGPFNVAEAKESAALYHEMLDAIAAQAATLPQRPRVYFEEWDDPQITGIRWVAELVRIAVQLESNQDLATV